LAAAAPVPTLVSSFFSSVTAAADPAGAATGVVVPIEATSTVGAAELAAAGAEPPGGSGTRF
jgi:hypothetical protein